LPGDDVEGGEAAVVVDQLRDDCISVGDGVADVGNVGGGLDFRRVGASAATGRRVPTMLARNM
jgi:hypothetical protein